MSYRTYPINKGINKALEFKGLKAQYVSYLGVGLVLLMILFAILHIAGISPWVCVGIIFGAAGLLFHYVYKISKRYGKFGVMKKQAAGRIPKVLVSRSRRLFYFKEENRPL